MKATEIKKLADGFISKLNEMDVPDKLPEDSFRSYLRGMEGAADAMLEVLGRFAESAEWDVDASKDFNINVNSSAGVRAEKRTRREVESFIGMK